MHNRISLQSIQAFEAAARLSSFALAAEELFVTLSAVSHQFKLLKEQCGVRLFHRVHRAVVLTDASRLYAEEVSAAFARIEMATRELGRRPRATSSACIRRRASPPADLLMQDENIDIHYGMKRLQLAEAV